MDFVESFEELKRELKEKWLDYYEENQHWIERLGVYRDVSYGENYRVHNPYFLIGVLSTLDPKFASLLEVFVKLNTDPKQIAQIFEILDLNLREELEKRSGARTQDAEIIPKAEIMPRLPDLEIQQYNYDPEIAYLNQIGEDMSQ